MMVLRLLLVFVFSTLLSSCEQQQEFKQDIQAIKTDIKALKQYITGPGRENPCHLGVPQTAQCYYVVTITAENYKTNGLRGGKTSKKVCEQNRDSGNPLEDCSRFSPAERFFPVKGSPALQKDSDYEFFSQVTDPPTAELVCVDQKGNVTPQCVARTTPLPKVP
jgi:hypothetical protein